MTKAEFDEALKGIKDALDRAGLDPTYLEDGLYQVPVRSNRARPYAGTGHEYDYLERISTLLPHDVDWEYTDNTSTDEVGEDAAEVEFFFNGETVCLENVEGEVNSDSTLVYGDVYGCLRQTLEEVMESYGLRLGRTCYACPEQYDLKLGDRCVGYLRLRHGHFRADYYPPYTEAYGLDLDNICYETEDIKGDGLFHDEEERNEQLFEAQKAIFLRFLGELPVEPEVLAEG